MTRACLLVDALVRPESVRTLALRDWDLLIRQARHANLMGRLAARLAAKGLLSGLPHQPRAHLDAALTVAQRQRQAVEWEVNRILQALEGVPAPVVLLKGAAYVLQGNPAAEGRTFSDVDILVPREQLEAAELALKMHGWITTHHSEYDQRYYRQWMHELPPMQHMSRQTVVDLHHGILPETARLRPDPRKLVDAAVALEGHGPRLKVLSPVDMVLHSATHLFHEGEFDHGLRDLTDLDALLRHFAAGDEQFWTRLVERAKQLDLAPPLHYALRYAKAILDTPVSAAVLQTAAAGGPGWLKGKFMDSLFARAFAPRHPSCDGWWTRPALWLLFVRSHWLKMPLPLLVPHLLHQAFARADKA
jgi:hypothetical protein